MGEVVICLNLDSFATLVVDPLSHLVSMMYIYVSLLQCSAVQLLYKTAFFQLGLRTHYTYDPHETQVLSKTCGYIHRFGATIDEEVRMGTPSLPSSTFFGGIDLSTPLRHVHQRLTTPYL